MKKLLVLGLLTGILATGCRKIVEDAPPSNNNGSNNGGNNGGNTTGQTITLAGKIDKDTTLKANNSYILNGLVYITNNATITIEPGTTIKGQYTDPVGGLVITRGAKINAKGTATNPIVFTSASGTPRAGDWAGIVLLGKAKTNSSFNGQAGVGEIEGGVNDAAGNGLYGGTDDADSSGALQYVRIEYAGYAFLPDKEINSLTMGGVGNKTVLDHIQVSYAKDDAFEWFGGSVNAKYLIAFRTQDDDFDTDNGYRGNVQFGLVVRDSSVADISKSEAMESDNDANGSTNAPQTAAVFSNLTLIGPRATLGNKGSSNYLGAAVQIRRNSALSLYNSVILGWQTGILIDASKGRPTDLNIVDSTLRVRNNIIAGVETAIKYSASTTTPTGETDASMLTWFSTPFYGNTVLTTVDDAKFVNPFNYTSPDFAPFGTSSAATGAKFTDTKLAGMKQVTFRGAIAAAGEDANWWKGWTKF
ncbi:hypothetical protein OCK74_04160 [Chitinophagaceae bacterium LB-8]|uniref:T9SS C-terminal target domain-containing protein n=1 Tax=Paraflavisolibacter caeni TaxID=2982496 RepID=A0A9X2XTS1_9BACT|nr:hypothetical protein [Paraflavisolibacter caeni]MCU7548292.1 hypothetical protein [Paraflavisolibacter caeni]